MYRLHPALLVSVVALLAGCEGEGEIAISPSSVSVSQSNRTTYTLSGLAPSRFLLVRADRLELGTLRVRFVRDGVDAQRAALEEVRASELRVRHQCGVGQ